MKINMTRPWLTRTRIWAATLILISGSVQPQSLLAQAHSWKGGVQIGFYESPNNWLPNGVPEGATAMATFDNDESVKVGMLNDHVVGELMVTNGAEVYISPAGQDPTNKLLEVMGDATISNGKLRLQVQDFSEVNDLHLKISNHLSIDGQLRAYDGARVSSTSADIGITNDVNNVVVISGEDSANGRSSWNVDGTIVVGKTGEGQLTVEHGAIVNSFVGSVGRSNEDNNVYVTGVSRDGQPSTWNSNVVASGAGGYGRVSVLNGGRINSTTGLLGSSGNAYNTVAGTDEAGRPSTWNSETLSIADQGEGILTIVNGGQVNTDEMIIARTAGSDGTLIIRANDDRPTSTWNNSGDVSVGGYGQNNGGKGTLEIQSNTQSKIDGSINIWPQGLVTLQGGSLVANRIDTSHGGGFEFRDGTLSVAEFEGQLFQLGGVLAPGTYIGRTVIRGGLVQQDDAATAFDIAGTTAGETHDRIAIDGNAAVNGQLMISITNGFSPSSADQFAMMSADALLGRFDNVGNGERLLTTDRRGSFQVNYGFGSAYNDNELILSDFGITGDFNTNGQLDANDIDLLSEGTSVGDPSFDLTGDGVVDRTDRTYWVEYLKGTYFGDANLDGEFNSSDFVQVFQRGHYEDRVLENSGWEDGDWNGDGEFDTADFVLAFQSGGYEAGPRSSVASVPEPTGVLVVLLGMLVGFGRTRRNVKGRIN